MLTKFDSCYLQQIRPYDERTYLQTLADRNPPLNWGAGASTKPVWKTVGGFKKLSTENS
jgi:hypothetical protein